MGMFDKLKATAEKSAANLKERSSELAEKGTAFAEQSASTLKERGSELAAKGSDFMNKSSEIIDDMKNDIGSIANAPSSQGSQNKTESDVSPVEQPQPTNPAEPERPIYEPVTDIQLDAWSQKDVSETTFTLNGETATIPLPLAKYNMFRKRFSEYAESCVCIEQGEYEKAIYDYNSFMDYYPMIFMSGAHAISQRATDALIANGVYSTTVDDVFKAHTDRFHESLDIGGSYVAKADELSEHNRTSTLGGVFASYSSSLMPEYRQIFSKGSALKDIQHQNRLNMKNIVSAGVAKGLMTYATALKPEQLQALYDNINPDELFSAAFRDYANVSIIFAEVLKKNGGDIWTPPASMDRVAATLTNMENPNFPKDQLSKVFLDILLFNPYDERTQRLFIDTFGENEETEAVRSYFGF